MEDAMEVNNMFATADRYETLDEFLDVWARFHNVTPYAIILHLLACSSWSAKVLAGKLNRNRLAVYAVMYRLGAGIPGGQSGALAAMASHAGMHDVVEYGKQLIRQYGNYKRAARVLCITAAQFARPFEARALSYDNTNRLQIEGQIGLFSGKGFCEYMGWRYDRAQTWYIGDRERGLEYESFQAFLAHCAGLVGESVRVVSVLGWDKRMVAELDAIGKEAAERAQAARNGE